MTTATDGSEFDDITAQISKLRLCKKSAILSQEFERAAELHAEQSRLQHELFVRRLGTDWLDVTRFLPTEDGGLGSQLLLVRREKEAAILAQEFEKAAELHEEESRLYEKWRTR